MHVSAYACIRMHGMHIPFAGAAHQGGYLGGGPRTLNPGTYIYMWTHVYNIITYDRVCNVIYTRKKKVTVILLDSMAIGFIIAI